MKSNILYISSHKCKKIKFNGDDDLYFKKRLNMYNEVIPLSMFLVRISIFINIKSF